MNRKNVVFPPLPDGEDSSFGDYKVYDVEQMYEFLLAGLELNEGKTNEPSKSGSFYVKLSDLLKVESKITSDDIRVYNALVKLDDKWFYTCDVRPYIEFCREHGLSYAFEADA